jgi:hypothetical protein
MASTQRSQSIRPSYVQDISHHGLLKVPGDVALFLGQNEHTEELARELAHCMDLPEPELQLC